MHKWCRSSKRLPHMQPRRTLGVRLHPPARPGSGVHTYQQELLPRRSTHTHTAPLCASRPMVARVAVQVHVGRTPDAQAAPPLHPTCCHLLSSRARLPRARVAKGTSQHTVLTASQSQTPAAAPPAVSQWEQRDESKRNQSKRCSHPSMPAAPHPCRPAACQRPPKSAPR
jgi:hypothetical protein